MDASVFALVLLAAACHAGWNAAIKLGLDPFSVTAMIAVSSGIIALPVLVWTGFPILAAWPWLAASIFFHVGYYIGLTEAYRHGDMGQVYPIARGTAPLMTATVSTFVLQEGLGWRGWAGVATLALGVMLLSLRGGRLASRFDGIAVGFALFTAVTIAGYSIVDGVGARTAGNPHAYTAAFFVCNAVMVAFLAYWWRGATILRDVRSSWKPALAGGALSLASYWIAIWAMTVAPIAMVAALRETSVLFAALIAVVILREPIQPVRMIAAGMIVVGLVLIRLS